MSNMIVDLKFQEVRELQPNSYHFEHPSLVSEDDVHHLIASYGGYWKHSGPADEPHPILNSGMHGREYFDLSFVTQFSVPTEILCRLMADKLNHVRRRDWVIGPSYGASPLIYHLGNILKCKHAITEKEADDSQSWKRYLISDHEWVQLVEDVTTTGGSILRSKAGIIAGNRGKVKFFSSIAAFVNRSGKIEIEGFSIISLVKVGSPKQWKPGECELCKLGSEAISKFKYYLASQLLPNN